MADARRLSKNVVAIVVIMGLSIIPSLYAWFNILSNWDPYGSESTSNIEIAVFSNDKGAEISSVSLNVGDTVIEKLKTNEDIGWVFPESEEELMDGILSGEYYAALVVPDNFTEDLLSFISGEPSSPTIQYYENSKKNAIATKITSKVKTTVQREINESFVGTIAEYAEEAGEAVLGEDGYGEKIADNLSADLTNMSVDLKAYISIMDAFILVNDSAEGMLSSVDALLPAIGNVVESGSEAAEMMEAGADAGANTADAITLMADSTLEALIDNLDTVELQLDLISSGVDVSTVTDLFDEALGSAAFAMIEDLLNAAGESALSATSIYNEAKESYDKLVSDIEMLRSDAISAQNNVESLKNTLSADIENCKASIQSAKNDFDTRVAAKLSDVCASAKSSLSDTAALLAGIDTDFTDVTDLLDSYNETLEKGTASLADTRAYAAELDEELEKLITALNGLSTSEQYEEVIALFSESSIALSDFFSSPVTLEEVEFYAIDTYGSAMAPFYTILGIWAGALLMVALIKVKVEKDEQLADVKPWQKFFGRYITFLIIGEIQAIITALGDLLYIGIQCVHPGLFILAAMVASFVFTLLMYSLTVAFRQVGQAIIVVILVIQVAGAGGTFPVEMLPEAYQMVYKFLPFPYAMDALRECVGGLYGMSYLHNILMLLIFAAVAIVIGLVMRRPFESLNRKMDKSKEKSGIML